jgi:tRNA(fMet)-specific endonuclease VapC
MYLLRAAERFHALWIMRLRIGTMDLKIAATALANDATLLTRNTSDFGRIPGLRIEDWSV